METWRALESFARADVEQENRGGERKLGFSEINFILVPLLNAPALRRSLAFRFIPTRYAVSRLRQSTSLQLRYELIKTPKVHYEAFSHFQTGQRRLLRPFRPRLPPPLRIQAFPASRGAPPPADFWRSSHSICSSCNGLRVVVAGSASRA